MTEHDLSFAQRYEVASIEVEVDPQQRLIEFESLRSNLTQEHRQDQRAVCGRVAKAGQQWRRIGAQQGNRPAPHAGPGPDAALSECENCSRNHVESDHVARRAADGDQAAPHREADFIARVAVDDDRAARHALHGAAVGGAEQMSRISANVNESSVHFGPCPAASVPVDVNLSAAQFAADMPARGSVNLDPTARHMSADPVHTGQISLELEVFITGITPHVKHLREGNLAIAVKDLEAFDVRQRLVAGPIGCQPFNFDGDVRLAVIAEFQGQAAVLSEGVLQGGAGTLKRNDAANYLDDSGHATRGAHPHLALAQG
jgi:hypothetical protein